MTATALTLWLDLIGVFVFGISGAMLAIRRGLDAFGVAVLAVAASLAGGLLRDVMLGATPPAALADSRYLIAALASAAFTFFLHRQIERVTRPVMVLDAAGLGLFAVAGCQKALTFGLEPLSAILLGVLTAVGGGVVRDILVTETPRILREEVYAMAAMTGAVMIWFADDQGYDPVWSAVISILVVFLIRIVSVWRGWRAPKAPGSN